MDSASKRPADYKDTLNLPSTDFPMRANLPNKEPEIKAKWDSQGLYHGIMKANEGKPLFVLHDGPPYANGDMHIGHALNKLLKDFITKSKNMAGFKAPYIHGWDTHGLPIENQMLKKHGQGIDSDLNEFRKKCEEFARENVARQMTQQQRLGVIGDWENSYLTLMPRYEAKQIRIFGEMAERGHIYKGLRPVYWCPKDETALAEAEIEYFDEENDSVFVKFEVTDDKGLFAPHTKDGGKVYFVIWTTTIWTLPGNLAICLNGEFSYTLYKNKAKDEYYVMATELAEGVGKITEVELEAVAEFRGEDLERMITAHPFMGRDSLVILGDHVTLESGTGCVHTAPGHGVEDFEVAKNYPELGVVVPVDEKGRMTAEAGVFAGQTTDKANKSILKALKDSDNLLGTEHIVHQYPHCWRCKTPILFRATEQWFCSIDSFKEKAIEAIKSVKWIPAWGEARIENMVRDRADWCISRQRKWGVPIPIFYCADCNHPIINNKTIDKITAMVEQEGSGAWYNKTPEQILGDEAFCPKCGGKELRAEQDIMDVWFDSGSSYAYVLDDFPDHHFPADAYLEGNDQYRGWFQSSLLTSVATREVAPYKSVITHGMIVDGEGKKMSKSLGNGVEPLDVVKEYGADVLRLWVSSVEYTTDVRISKDILKQLSEIYRKIRNTIRILLGNLGDPETDFDPNHDLLPADELLPLDKWALAKLNGLVGRARKAYDNYQFHMIYHDVHNYCAIDLSKLYIDITKDRLYCEALGDKKRRSVQTAMYLISHSLIRLLAPILSFTAEEGWGFIRHLAKDNSESVFYNQMPKYESAYEFPDEEARFDRLFKYRDDVMKALELAREGKVIGKSLEAKVTIYGSEDNLALQEFVQNEDLLKTIFIVSGVELKTQTPPKEAFTETDSGIGVLVTPAEGEKCVRCWTFFTDVIYDHHDQPICKRCAEVVY